MLALQRVVQRHSPPFAWAARCTTMAMPNVKLDPRPARKDLTDRECAKLLGGFLGVLIAGADVAAVKRAIDWWSENESAWTTFRKMKAYWAETPNADIATVVPFGDEPPRPGK